MDWVYVTVFFFGHRLYLFQNCSWFLYSWHMTKQVLSIYTLLEMIPTMFSGKMYIPLVLFNLFSTCISAVHVVPSSPSRNQTHFQNGKLLAVDDFKGLLILVIIFNSTGIYYSMSKVHLISCFNTFNLMSQSCMYINVCIQALWPIRPERIVIHQARAYLCFTQHGVKLESSIYLLGPIF